MPIIPEHSQTGGSYQPASPSLGASMAPGLALARVGDALGDAGSTLANIADRRQQEQDHGANSRAKLAMQQALQDHELYRAENPDESTWQEDMTSRLAGVRSTMEKEQMSPAARQQLNTDLDSWSNLYGTQVKADAARNQRARNRTSTTQLIEAYRRSGKFDDAEREANNAVASGLFHKDEMAPEMESLRMDREQKVKDDAFNAEKAEITANPFGYREKYASPDAPEGQDQAEYTRLRDFSNDRLRYEQNRVLGIVQDSIASGQIKSPDQLNEYKDELGEDAVKDMQLRMLRVRSNAEKQMIETPAEQSAIVGRITTELSDLDPANVRHRLAIEDLLSDLKPGPTKEHLSSQLKNKIEGKVEPVTPASLAFQALDDYDGRVRALLPKPEKMTTRQILGDGFLLDMAKVQSVGFTEDAAEEIAKAEREGKGKGQALFKKYWGDEKKRPAGSGYADEITIMAADALRLDNATIDSFTSDSIQRVYAAEDEYLVAKGERRERLASYLKANPKATLTDIREEVRAISDDQASKSIRVDMMPARPARAGVKTSGFRNGETSFTLPKNLEPLKQSFIEQGTRYGIDPRFLAAVSMHETANGTSSAFRNKNNAMGVSNASGPISFGATQDSIARMARVLASPNGPYRNASTLSGIASVYAPPGAGNDPGNLNPHWSAGVSKYLRQLGGDPDAIFLR